MKRVTRLLVVLALASLLGPHLTVAEQFRYMEPEELLKQIEAKADIVLLDARSAEEYAKAHIKGTLNYAGIEVEGLDLPHSRPIVIYCDCDGGDSSMYLATRLIKNGYNPENIFVLRGGWYKWLELGYPVDKGN
jgi:rhodanese-related sulfurtransferase